MHGYVNKENVKTSHVSFRFSKAYVNQSYRPRLLSDMVDEATRTGQLPNVSPFPPLKTETEDIDSLSPETPNGDKIDGYNRGLEIIDYAEEMESKYKSTRSDYEKVLVDEKKKSRLKDFEEFQKANPPAPNPA